MGKVLVSFFEQIGKVSGLDGQIKLAMMTSMSQKVCEGVADSQDNISRFNRAYKNITGQDSGIR